jgi:hypothetical protein
MSEDPRRRRANAWVWVYLALFGSDEDTEETTDDSASAPVGTTERESK